MNARGTHRPGPAGRNHFVLSCAGEQSFTNAGPGPAAIKAITFYVDRKPVADADEMGRTYAKLPAAELDYQIMEPGDTLAVGEKIWLISYRKPRGGKVNQQPKRRSATSSQERHDRN